MKKWTTDFKASAKMSQEEKQLNSDIAFAVARKDGKSLMNLEKFCEAQIEKLDEFFDLYLDKFSNRMNKLDKNSQEWKLYNKKFNEYEVYSDAITAVRIYQKNII